MSDQKFQQKCEELAEGLTQYSASDLANIYTTEAKGAKWSKFGRLMRRIDRAGLDIFRDQAYIVRQKDKESGEVSIEFRSSIQALRMRADATGKYAGQEGPWWTDDGKTWRDVWLEEEPPKAAMVHVLRSDFEKPMRGVAKFEEYAARYSRSGDLIAMWGEMPAHMIAKCAEALAIKRAFPQKTGGILTRAEMHRDDKEGANARDTREPADAHEETQRNVDAANEALLGGSSDGAPSDAPAGDGAPPEGDNGNDLSGASNGASESRRDPAPTKGEEYQKKAREATEQRAQENGAPDRTISTGEGSQLNKLFADGVHNGPYTKKALKKMVKREFGHDSLTDIRAEEFDRVLRLAQDEQMAHRYHGDPDTPDMFDENGESGGEPADDESPHEALVESVLSDMGAEVAPSEHQQLCEIAFKVGDDLSSRELFRDRVSAGAEYLKMVDSHTSIRRRVTEAAAQKHDVTPIPQDFPFRAKLTGANAWTMQEVHNAARTGALSGVDGIGDKRREEIVSAMAQLDFTPLPPEDDVSEETREKADKWDDNMEWEEGAPEF